MTRLCQLLQRPRDPDSPVARRWDEANRCDRTLSFGEFRRDVAGLRARLCDEPAGAWLVLSDDAYLVAVSVFALWHSGRHAVLPPNQQAGALELLQQRTAGVLTDRPGWRVARTSLHPLVDGSGGEACELEELSPDAPALELYTSGTTGGEKPVTKRLCHLEDEVEELEGLWGAELAGTSFFATASPQHLYGMLFGVLWPLCAERPFQANPLLHVGELVPRMQAAGSCVLASVPTFLKRLTRHSQADSLRPVCRMIFSSGGPLPIETAHSVAKRIGHAPVEVLGSSETGGIAWREQEPASADSRWTPFPSVRVAADANDGVLRVTSPFVSGDETAGGFPTGDRIELHADGRFELLGRADRVVKVAEKRLDLDQMARQLRQHPTIEEVALTTLERDSELRVAAAIVPSQQGFDWLRARGRRDFTAALREGLADDWDPVLRPRVWRILPALPENPQGKVTSEALRRLFEDHEANASGDRPEVVEEVRGDDFLERSCRVPVDLSCFAGHFPDVPVVPGVLQLDWAMDAAAAVVGESPDVCEIEALKLAAPLGPGAHFRLNVRLTSSGDDPSQDKLEFRLFGRSQVHSIGRVRLREAARTSR